MSDERVRNLITKMISLSLVHSVVFREVLSSKETPNIHISTQIEKKLHWGNSFLKNCSDNFSVVSSTFMHLWPQTISAFLTPIYFLFLKLGASLSPSSSRSHSHMTCFPNIYFTWVGCLLISDSSESIFNKEFIYFFCIYFGTMRSFKRRAISVLH